jgi:hypothetical protein
MMEMLFHYYFNPSPFRDSEGSTSFSLKRLEELELLKSYPVRTSRVTSELKIKITERGKAHVRILLEVPLPILTWATPTIAGATT